MTISEIQDKLKKENINSLIVTRNNMFLGQDILEEENQLKALTGFSGSAGNLLICQDKSFLFVDGRYDLQAQKEVTDTNIEIVCTKDTIATWMSKNLASNTKIAYNSWCHTTSEVDYWFRRLKKFSFIESNDIFLNPIISDKEADIFEHEVEFCGIDRDEKISLFTKFMSENNLDAFLITSCDCLSWLLNLRSNIIPNTPILRAYGLIDKKGEISLFTKDFDTLDEEFSKYKSKRIGVTFNQAPKKIYYLLKKHNIWVDNLGNPIQNWKAVKNEVELSNIRNAHIKDGVSITNFLFWLSKNAPKTTELDVVEKIAELKKGNEHFYSNSFNTIAAYAENGAIVHYCPTKETNKTLENGSLLLIDTGSQYFDGTTDISRTIAIGKPSQEMVDDFTTVLKAHISLANAYFPLNTSGQTIDAICRHKLWSKGLDYSHGTGHGVGFFASVHEGPQSISSKSSAPIKENMIMSIEPGCYKENKYGIRIENLVQTTSTEYPEMLKFDTLSLAPIDKTLINKSALDNEEIKWINDYHKKVFSILQNKLDKATSAWLKKSCSPL